VVLDDLAVPLERAGMELIAQDGVNRAHRHVSVRSADISSQAAMAHQIGADTL
jgi:hypothetical protein